MIYIIGNTLFGYPKMIDIQIDYFKNSFIPFLKKTKREGDILVHTGNIFYNKQTAHFKVLKETFDVFDELSDLMPIFLLKGSNEELSLDLLSNRKGIKVFKEIKRMKNLMFVPQGEFLMPDNDIEYLFYCTPLKDVIGVKRSFNGYFENEKGNDININITSPYQLNKDFITTGHGFYAFNLKQNDIRFIENNYSPKFKEIYIDDLSQLQEIHKSKDFIDLVINSKVVELTENKNKVDMFLSKHDFHNVYFTESFKKEKEVIIKNNNDIRNILIDNAEEDMVEDLNEIFKIYDSTKNI